MVNLIRIKLVNFVGIYYGMGLNEIEINRKNSNNNIILIVGDNGSGKTTLMNELTPFPLESNGDRYKSRIIPDKIGIKELDYIVDDFILYKIKIIYDNKAKNATTKCFITKYIDNKEIELNPNGNVNSYLECIFHELHITKNYTNIGYLSGGEAGSSNKNFISMKPTERNNYISEWMPEISEFLDAFKVSSKILSKLKKDIDNYNKQIGNMTSINYELELNMLNTNIEATNSKLKEINNKITQLETYNNQFEKYLLTDKELEDQKNNWITNLNRLNKYFQLITEKWKDFDPNIIKTEEEFHKLIKDTNKIEQEINHLEESMNLLAEDIKSSKNMLNTDDSLKEVDIKTIYKTIELAEIELKDIKKSILDIEEKYKITEDLNIEPDILVNIKSIIQILDDKFIQLNNVISIDSIIEFNDLNKTIDDKVESLKTLNELKQYNSDQLKFYNNEIYKYENSNLDTEILMKRPQFCINKKCGIVEELLKYLNPKENISHLYENSKKYQDELINIENQIEEVNKTLNDYKTAYSIYDEINHFLYKNSEKIAEFPKILSDIFKENPAKIYIRSNYIKELIEDLSEYSSLILKQSTTITTIDGLKKIKAFLIQNDHIEEKIAKASLQYDNFDKKQKELIEIYENNRKTIEIYENFDKLNSERQEDFDLYEKLSINAKNAKYNLLEKFKVNYIIKSNKYYIENTLYNESLKLEQELLELNKKRDEMTTFYISKRQIEKMRNELLEKYNRVLVLNNIWSPKIGYVSMIIESFLNKLTLKTNEDLNNMWGSNLKINQFIIDASDFKIEINKEGNIIEDASLCSQGERSTINTAISFAIIESKIEDNGYDVIRLDEVDGALDDNRRNGFLTMIQNRINEMGCDTCAIISHNGEFDNIPCDLILLKTDKPFPKEKLLNKNILFKY